MKSYFPTLSSKDTAEQVVTRVKGSPGRAADPLCWVGVWNQGDRRGLRRARRHSAGPGRGRAACHTADNSQASGHPLLVFFFPMLLKIVYFQSFNEKVLHPESNVLPSSLIVRGKWLLLNLTLQTLCTSSDPPPCTCTHSNCRRESALKTLATEYSPPYTSQPSLVSAQNFVLRH